MRRACAAALLAGAALAAPAAAAEQVLLAQDFDSVPDGTTIDRLGWRVVDPAGTCRMEVRGKALRVTSLTAKALQGGYAEIPVPLCVRGQLDAEISSDHTVRDGVGLYLGLYNITTFWHEYCGDWRRYFPDPVARRQIGFTQEPVGHRSIVKFAKRKANHYRIIFDQSADRVEYYLNDFADPVYIDGGVPVWGQAEFLGGVLRLGSWGNSGQTLSFTVDNLRLLSFDGAGDAVAATPARDQVMVFNGLSQDRYAVRRALESTGMPAARIRDYHLLHTGAALGVENTFIASRLPAMAATARTATFVFADFPAGPGQVVPDCVQEDILANVRQGARLLMLGGMCSFGRGGYATGPLAAALPVRLAGTWDLAALAPALAIDPPQGPLAALPWAEGPTVSYLHTLAPVADATVALTGGGRPFLVRRALGKGEVVALLGTACGPDAAPAFWRWSGWPALLAELVRPPAP
jgi:hypothetical protein